MLGTRQSFAFLLLVLLLHLMHLIHAQQFTKPNSDANANEHEHEHANTNANVDAHINTNTDTNTGTSVESNANLNSKSNANEAQMETSGKPESADSERARIYPDYCWFTGLENRIGEEYPSLKTLLREHRQALDSSQWQEAVILHQKLFSAIYAIALERAETSDNKVIRAKTHVEPQVLASYTLYDLWANTPGDYTASVRSTDSSPSSSSSNHQSTEHINYELPYVVHSHVEFWAYYYDMDNGHEQARRLLNMLHMLVTNNELGPIELLQVSLNIIKLINFYSSDLMIDKLIGRGKLDESQYTKWLEIGAKLMEVDDDFHWAAYDYVHKHALDLDVKRSPAQTDDDHELPTDPESNEPKSNQSKDEPQSGTSAASDSLPMERPMWSSAAIPRSLSAHIHSIIDGQLERYLVAAIVNYQEEKQT